MQILSTRILQYFCDKSMFQIAVLKERPSTSILCSRALLSTAYVRCHMKMAAAVDRQNATRAKDAGWPAFFKNGNAKYQNILFHLTPTNADT